MKYPGDPEKTQNTTRRTAAVVPTVIGLDKNGEIQTVFYDILKSIYRFWHADFLQNVYIDSGRIFIFYPIFLNKLYNEIVLNDHFPRSFHINDGRQTLYLIFINDLIIVVTFPFGIYNDDTII